MTGRMRRLTTAMLDRLTRRARRSGRAQFATASTASIVLHWLVYHDAQTGRRDDILRIANAGDSDARHIDLELLGAAADTIELHTELPASIGPQCHRDLHIDARRQLERIEVTLRWRDDQGRSASVLTLSPDEITV